MLFATFNQPPTLPISWKKCLSSILSISPLIANHHLSSSIFHSLLNCDPYPNAWSCVPLNTSSLHLPLRTIPTEINHNRMGSREELPGWWACLHTRGWCTPTPQERKLLGLGPSQTLLCVPHHLVVHLFVSFMTSFNKPVIMNRCLPAFYHLLLANRSNASRELWEPPICSQAGSRRWPRDLLLVVSVYSGGWSGGTEPLALRSASIYTQVGSELN